MRSVLLILAVAASCTFSNMGAASAQGLVRVQAPPLRVCSVDYMRFCRGVRPGGGRIVLCLNEHASELTQPCFQALAMRGLAAASALKACRVEYERMCALSGPGPARGLACLLDHAESLGRTCRDALSKQGLLGDEPEEREFRK